MNPPPPVPLSYQSPGTTAERFTHAQYVVRKKVFKLLGAAFHVYDTAGSVVLYSKQKAFKLREDIRLYTDPDMTTELLTIKARQILDFSAAYDVVDLPTGRKIGAFKRKGWTSLVRDAWVIMDADDREAGRINEDSVLAALFRRMFDGNSILLPQAFHAELGGETVATFRQNHNPFVRKLTVDFSPDVHNRFDRRLGLAAAVLLAAIEGRQT